MEAMTKKRLPLKPSDVEALAREYDAAPELSEECVDLWHEYARYVLDVQAGLADEFTMYLVNVPDPYGHGRELLADLVKGQYKVPAPQACPQHPCWDGAAYSASRTVHDLTGHGYAGTHFDLEGEIYTVLAQAKQVPEHLVAVTFSDTMQQLCSTLYNHEFAPQKVVLTEHTKLVERVLNMEE